MIRRPDAGSLRVLASAAVRSQPTAAFRFGRSAMRARGWKRNLSGYLFVSPWLLGFIIFTAGPIIASFGLSFTFFDMISAPRWVGLRNFQRLFFDDPLFFVSLYNTLYYVAFSVPFGLAIALLMALMLNGSLRGMAAYRTVFYLPVAVPAVARSIP